MAKRKKILIIGGGASGMMAAITSARRGAEVLVFEQLDKVGRKILATGNGRCNLTNINMDINRFHGKNPKFAYAALTQFDSEKAMEFFEDLGIWCKTESDGKVYPYSLQASSVLDVMRYEMERLGIKELCGYEAKRIEFKNNKFTVSFCNGESYTGDSVIIATGGKASPNLGSRGRGYELAGDFGHKLIEPFPALVQLKLSAQFLRSISGVKFMGRAEIGVGNKSLRTEDGEILFTDYGISGPPIFQLSRSAGEELKGNNTPWLRVDMVPELTHDEIEDIIGKRMELNGYRSVNQSFIGVLNKKLIPVVLREAGIENPTKPISQLSNNEIKSLVNILKGWTFYVTGTQTFKEAQVTAGGIDVKDINPSTMESRLRKGLYLTGEVLDIDGDCGGFNLQWAWSSGYVAGISASN